MLISHERRFIFIHVSKAAGTSIQQALRSYADPPSGALRPVSLLAMRLGATRALPRRARLYREHASAAALRRQVGRAAFESHFSFAFVRNPWDWMVSLFEYLRRTDSHRHSASVRRMTFAEYVDFEIARGRRSQSEFVVDRRGRVIVDFIGRFERLEADFARVCRVLGMRAALPHANGSSHHRPDYRAYYTHDALIERVGVFLRADVERFGYQFDGATWPAVNGSVSGESTGHPVLATPVVNPAKIVTMPA